MEPHAQARSRLAVMVSVPLAFCILFFAATVLTQNLTAKLLRAQGLSSSLTTLRALAGEIDTGERGYRLTGNQYYLTLLVQARSALQLQITACLNQAKDQDSITNNKISRLIALVRQRADQANEATRAGLTPTVPAATAEGNERAEQIMNAIRRLSGDIQKDLDRQERASAHNQEWLNLWTFVIFAGGSSVLLAVMFRLYRDSITYLHGRDAAEARLQQLNADLETQVEIRTRALKVANEELQQFAYVASHDLQEPLRTVTSFSQLLEARYKGRLDQDADEFIAYIVNASRRMTDLINGLLSLARLRKSGQTVEAVSFKEILVEAQMALQASIRENDAEITADNLPALVVDRSQLLQVIQNLLSNAIKYRSEGPPRIRVSAQRRETEWVFSVQDNGRGFDPQFSERIFGLFQRLHPREVADGTGIGLAITRKIVERHGGRIWADSSVGKGSTFFFSLPASLEPARHPSSGDNVNALAQTG